MSSAPISSNGQTNSQADATFGAGIGNSPLPPMEPTTMEEWERPTVAIMSFGEMGMGIAALLKKYSYRVITSLEGRSAKTKERAAAIGIEEVPFHKLVLDAAVLLSIVPPAEALTLAMKTAAAVKGWVKLTEPLEKGDISLVYMDLNATSPSLSRRISEVIDDASLTFVDGAILGFPPRELADGTWFRPALTISGPPVHEVRWCKHLVTLLNIRHISPDIGAASGLKMCFGSIYKGQAAVATQAYTTAKNLGVLEELRGHMKEYFPATSVIVENSILGEQRKAYRWIREMEEIEETFATDGGWERDLFKGVRGVFEVVARKTELEQKPGTDIDEVVEEICLGLRRTKSL